MGEQVYEQPFQVVECAPQDVPATSDTGRLLGRHLNGCRIGFDLGASDRKVSAVVDGKVVYSEEVVWEPRKHADPEYHYREIVSALKRAAREIASVDAIGGSAAPILPGAGGVRQRFRGFGFFVDELQAAERIGAPAKNIMQAEPDTINILLMLYLPLANHVAHLPFET